jgi:hypothetical protein
MNTARLVCQRAPLLTARARAIRPQCAVRFLTTSSRPQHASVSPVERPAELDNQVVAAMGRTTSGKALKIRKYPTFERLEDERLYRKQHLAAAYRVFAERGFDEGVAGHISVRDPILTDHFCMLVFLSVCGGLMTSRAEPPQHALLADMRFGPYPRHGSR